MMTTCQEVPPMHVCTATCLLKGSLHQLHSKHPSIPIKSRKKNIVNSKLHITNELFYFPDLPPSSDGQRQTDDCGKWLSACLTVFCSWHSCKYNMHAWIAAADCGMDVYWLYDRLISAHQIAITSTPALQNLSGLSRSSDDDLMLMACDMPQPTAPANALHQPQGFGNLEFGLSQLPATGKLVGCLFPLILTSTCFTKCWRPTWLCLMSSEIHSYWGFNLWVQSFCFHYQSFLNVWLTLSNWDQFISLFSDSFYRGWIHSCVSLIACCYSTSSWTEVLTFCSNFSPLFHGQTSSDFVRFGCVLSLV